MFDPRTKLSEQVVEEVQRYFGDLVYDIIIPRTVRLSEAPGYGQPITVYDPKSKGAETLPAARPRGGASAAARPSPCPSTTTSPPWSFPAVVDTVTPEPLDEEELDERSTPRPTVHEVVAEPTEAEVEEAETAEPPEVGGRGRRRARSRRPADRRHLQLPCRPSGSRRSEARGRAARRRRPVDEDDVLGGPGCVRPAERATARPATRIPNRLDRSPTRAPSRTTGGGHRRGRRHPRPPGPLVRGPADDEPTSPRGRGGDRRDAARTRTATKRRWRLFRKGGE